MQAMGCAHMGMVETVQVMAGIEDDEGVVDMFRPFERFADGEGVTELPCEIDQSGLFSRKLPAVMYNDQQPVAARGEQEPAQQFDPCGAIEIFAERFFEHPDDPLRQRDHLVDQRLVLAVAFEAPVLGVMRIAGQFHLCVSFNRMPVR